MNKRACLVLAIAVLVEPAAYAYDLVGAVVEVRVDASGKGLVRLSNANPAPASCVSTSYYDAAAFDTNTSGGKSVLALALSAQASGRQVWAKLSSSCGVYGSIQDWNYGFSR